MTDRQIVYAYLARVLGNAACAPDFETMRELSETALTPHRCRRIAEQFAAEAMKIRQKYVDRLNRAGVEIL